MARMANKKVTAQQRQWRRVRFIKLRGMFTDNEITQGRLNLVGMRNKALRAVVRERKVELKALTKSQVATWRRTGVPKTKITETLYNARRNSYLAQLILEAHRKKIRELRRRGKQIRDLLDEAT